jgi:hypothetical protein
MRRNSFVSWRLRRVVVAPALAVVLFGAQVLGGTSIGFAVPAQVAVNKPQPNRIDPKSAATSIKHVPKTQAAPTGHQPAVRPWNRPPSR